MDRILIAIATCRRNKLLVNMLLSLDKISPPPGTIFEVCIGDNDPQGGARQQVLSISNKLNFSLSYIHSPTLGIPQVRNALLRHALDLRYTALIFIDDDEIVSHDWLDTLWTYYKKNRLIVQAVHGPILPNFLIPPSNWLPIDLYSRDLKLPTGTELNLAATGNILIQLDFIREKELFFDERMALTGGSDTEYFYRFTQSGGVIHWCNEARVYEDIPQSRMTLKWLCRRYFRYGTSDIKFWRLNHSLLNTLFWGIRRAIWNFIKNVSLLLILNKPKHYYVRHCVLLTKTFGLLFGLLGYSYLEYKSRHNQN